MCIYISTVIVIVANLLNRGYPNCWQMTPASRPVNDESQIVPQALLKQISTLPSLEAVPSTSLTSPSEQFAGEVPFTACENIQH